MDKQIVVITKEELQELIETSVRRGISKGENPKDLNLKDHLTPSEASVFLGLALQTIYGLTSRKKIPITRMVKKFIS